MEETQKTYIMWGIEEKCSSIPRERRTRPGTREKEQGRAPDILQHDKGNKTFNRKLKGKDLKHNQKNSWKAEQRKRWKMPRNCKGNLRLNPKVQHPT